MGRASRQPQLSKIEQLQRQRTFDYSKSPNSSGENDAWKLKSKQQLKDISTLLDIAEEKGILIIANKPGLLHKTALWRLDYQKTTTVSSKTTPAHYVLAIQDNQSAKSKKSISLITVYLPAHCYNCPGPVTTSGIVGILRACHQEHISHAVVCGNTPVHWLISAKISSPKEREAKEQAACFKQMMKQFSGIIRCRTRAANLKPPPLSLTKQMETIQELVQEELKEARETTKGALSPRAADKNRSKAQGSLPPANAAAKQASSSRDDKKSFFDQLKGLGKNKKGKGE